MAVLRFDDEPEEEPVMDQPASDEAAKLYARFPLKGQRMTRVFDIQPAESLHEPIEADMRIIEIPPVSKDVPFNPRDLERQWYKYKWSSELQDYHALSYAWGSHEKDATVLISDFPLNVTSNLNNALKRIRETIPVDESCITVWADAISINQKDLEERSDQVSMMGDIYCLAKSTTIWLGEASEEEVLAVEDEETDGMRTMIQSPWFTRRWVLQEMLLSNSADIWFQYGRWRYRYRHFRKWASRNREEIMTWDNAPYLLISNMPVPIDDEPLEVLDKELGEGSPPSEDEIRWERTHVTPHYRRGRENIPDLLVNLVRFRDTECSDPLDRVYALLGISKNNPPFKVNYLRPPPDLYMDVAKHYLKLDPTAVMASATFTSHPPGCDLPSWAPNWQEPRPPKTPRHRSCLEAITQWKFRVQDVEPGRLRKRGKILLVRGWVFQKCDHASRAEKGCLCCTLLGSKQPGELRQKQEKRLESLWGEMKAGEWVLWVERSKFGFVVRPEGEREMAKEKEPVWCCSLVSCFDAHWNSKLQAVRMRNLEPRKVIAVV